MIKSKLLTLLVSFAATCALAGCDNSGGQGGTTPVENTDTEIKINSLYEGMVALYQTKNYTLEVVHTYGTFREEIPDMIFTDNCIGYDSKNYEDFSVYYNDGNGIYRVAFADDFVSGEYLTDKTGARYTKLWDKDNKSFLATMYGASGEYIKGNVTKDTKEIEITDKLYKVRFMQTIIGNTNSYASVDSLTAKYENEKVIFNLVIGGGAHSYRVTLKNVGNTKSSHLKMFLDNNGAPFVPNHDLSEMRRLINKDNFVQRTYFINEGAGSFIGYQFFTEHYFYQTGNDYTVGNAYMEFDYKEDPTIDNDFDMEGIYLVSVSKDEQGKYVANLASANAYNSDTKEIEVCCNYPSLKLDLLKNLEYVKAGEVRNAHYEESAAYIGGDTKKYYVIEDSIVKNFTKNFSLDTSFEDVIFSTIAIEIKLAEEDKDSMVCFHAIGYYPGDGITYDILIPLYGFGDANRQALDILYSQYNKNAN